MHQTHGINSYLKKRIACPTDIPTCTWESMKWWDWVLGTPKHPASNIPLVSGHKGLGCWPEYVEQGAYDFIKSIADSYPEDPIIQINMPLGRILYLINDPDLTTEVLNDSKRFPRGEGLGPLQLILGPDGLTETNSQRERRHWIYEHIKEKSLPPLVAHMNDVAARKMDMLKKQLNSERMDQPRWVEIRAQEDMGVLIVQMLGHTLFDSSIDEAKAKQLLAHLDTVMTAQTKSILDPSVSLFLTILPECLSETKKAAKGFKEICNEIVDRYVEKPQTDRDPESYMAKTLENFGRDGLSTRIPGIIQAGADTSSKVLTWALIELAKDPSIAEELQAEITDLIEDDNVTMDHLNDMPKLNAFVEEVLRKYPPFFATIRNIEPSESPVTIGKFGSYKLDPGATVGLSPHLIHHKPTLYPDPNTFDPHRFSETPKGRHAWQDDPNYLTFSKGKHTCPGRHFATADIKVTVIHLLRNFNISLTDPNYTPKPVINVTMGPLIDPEITLTERLKR